MLFLCVQEEDSTAKSHPGCSRGPLRSAWAEIRDRQLLKARRQSGKEHPVTPAPRAALKGGAISIQRLEYKDNDLRVGGCRTHTLLRCWGAKSALVRPSLKWCCFFFAQAHVCLVSARSDGPDHADSLSTPYVSREPQLTCHLGGVFAQRAHSAHYYGDYPSNNPENHLRSHAQSIQNSKIQTSDACHGSQGPKFCPL